MRISLALSLIVSLSTPLCSNVPAALVQDEADPAQVAKDARTVETLLRLRSIDPKTKPKLKASVSRYLKTVKGTERFVEIVEAFEFTDAADGLVELAFDRPTESLGVQSARVLMKLKQGELLLADFNSKDAESQQRVIQLLGGVGNRFACDALVKWMTDEAFEKSVRIQALESLIRSGLGQKQLVEILTAKEFPADLNVVAAAAVAKSDNSQFRESVGKFLALPETANAEPLPALEQLVAARGSIDVGLKVFAEKGTCANCHVVGGQGKEVGPNLSEIGSKLSRDAMFVSILDPSAGISHNFETYTLETIDGEIVSGVLISETADEVSIKTAEALVRNIHQDDIEVMEKQKVSLMPEGLQKNLTVDELVSLVDYLMTLKKPAE